MRWCNKPVSTETLRRIVRFSKKPIAELRKLNRKLERAYVGRELTKYQLIYQLVFLCDSPNCNEYLCSQERK